MKDNAMNDAREAAARAAYHADNPSQDMPTGPNFPFCGDYRSMAAAALDAGIATLAAQTPHVDVLFDGPPGPEAGRFVEVEDAEGKSIRYGEWVDRGNGYWALRLPALFKSGGGQS